MILIQWLPLMQQLLICQEKLNSGVASHVGRRKKGFTLSRYSFTEDFDQDSVSTEDKHKLLEINFRQETLSRQ